MQLGLGHRGTALAEYLLMLAVAGALYVVIIAVIERAWRAQGARPV